MDSFPGHIVFCMLLEKAIVSRFEKKGCQIDIEILRKNKFKMKAHVALNEYDQCVMLSQWYPVGDQYIKYGVLVY